jgi:hypothetical protein
VLRGDTVTVTTAPLATAAPPALPQAIAVTLKPETPAATVLNFNVAPTTGTSFAFTVPRLAFGKWTISAAQGENQVSLTSPQVIEVKAKAPQIDAVSPKVVYLAKKENTLVVIGSGFTEDEGDYYLNFLDDQSPEGYTRHLSADGRQLTFSKVAVPGRPGKKRFTVVVGGVASNQVEITFSEFSDNTPRVWTLAILAGIVLAIYLILRSGKKELKHKVNDRSYFLSALFLDKQTNTYSLSQCQFYAWTAASILGYVYLATSKSMIQGSMAFPDMPEGLPFILLASAGTTVLAAGISNAKGDKGSGDIHPSMADFIATGGVVAAERLQFVVWTIVGVVTFIRLVFLSDPATMDGLPKIPDGFLQLMGISSAGYIGGKLARKAGPTITSVTASANDGVLALDLAGSGLSQNATFSIADDVIAPGQIQGDKNLPEIVQPDDANNETGFAKLLRLKIVSPKPEWLAGDAAITITNPDQQKSVAKLQVPGILSTTVDAASGAFTITGGPFEQDSTVEFNQAGNKASATAKVGEDNTITGTVQGLTKGRAATFTVTAGSSVKLGLATVSSRNVT